MSDETEQAPGGAGAADPAAAPEPAASALPPGHIFDQVTGQPRPMTFMERARQAAGSAASTAAKVSVDVGSQAARAGADLGGRAAAATQATIKDPATKARARAALKKAKRGFTTVARADRPADPRRCRRQGDLAPGEGEREPQGPGLGLPDRRDHDRRVIPAEHPVLDRADRRSGARAARLQHAAREGRGGDRLGPGRSDDRGDRRARWDLDRPRRPRRARGRGVRPGASARRGPPRRALIPGTAAEPERLTRHGHQPMDSLPGCRRRGRHPSLRRQFDLTCVATWAVGPVVDATCQESWAGNPTRATVSRADGPSGLSPGRGTRCAGRPRPRRAAALSARRSRAA